MDEKKLDKAMELFSLLLTGEEVSKKHNVELYEAYSSNAQVADMLDLLLKKANLRLYEYNYALYLSSGENNRVFGFTNDELKKIIGLRLNRELYEDSGTNNHREYVRTDDIIEKVSSALHHIIPKLEIFVKNETEDHSLRTIALLWEDMPMTAANDDMSTLKAARGSKVGFVKLVFNFLEDQNLFTQLGGRYYPKDRFRALVENYYEDGRGRLYEIAGKYRENSGNGDFFAAKKEEDDASH